MKPSALANYLNQINDKSVHKSVLSNRGGYITTSNAGRRPGESKSFPLGLDSLITTFKDILSNIAVFENEKIYSENDWRGFASNFSDNAASSLAGTQTKVFYVILNKLLNWANNDNYLTFSDNNISITTSRVQAAISALEDVANFYVPNENKNVQEHEKGIITLISEKELKKFALKSFKVLLKKYGYKKIFQNLSEKDSKINDIEYTGIKIKPYFNSGNLIGAFSSEQNKESLSSSGIQRFFEENLYLEDYPYAYFTTQWGDVENGTLTFNNLKKFITDLSEGDLEAIKLGDNYSLSQLVKSNKTTTQKIFYGAPGTGKSHKIESILENIPDDQKERITFHPEYDYSSFVGGYKPFTNAEGKIDYGFVPQVFTNIYIAACKNPDKDYYLAIEEINRGNCAEIFGDMFQLLDRNSNYSITPSKELQEYLKLQLTDKGIEGGKMKLPSNLHLLASMNTSDQSLFPMDSAFKRRWSWEYVPIIYPASENDTSNDSFNFTVKLDENENFKWIEFIKNVNIRIKSIPHLGADKCIGNFFIKPSEKEISLEEFINKAIFYLWVDVFKDEQESIFLEIDNNISFEDFFPIATSGKDNLKKLFGETILGVKINSFTEKIESLEDSVE